MALVRWEPAREIGSLQSEVNRLFDGFFGNGEATRRWVPAMDLAETDDNLVLRADLPGLKREDVNIEISDGVLTISGSRGTEREEKADNYYRVERASGSFSRALTLPKDVDADAVTADFEDGVLEVRIPKPEERKPHRVEIGEGSVEGTAEEK